MDMDFYMTTLAPPYPMIWDEIEQGKIIPFLGAGASLIHREAGVEWDNHDSAFLPSAGELSEYLAKWSQYPPEENDKTLSKVASYVELRGGRSNLTGPLSEIFHHKANPGPVHEFLASINELPIIVTTNYDDLIESAFQKAGKPYHLVSYPVDRKDIQGSILWWKPGKKIPEELKPNELPLPNDDITIIYKMHGSIDPDGDRNDSFLITEEDYIEFLSRMTEKAAIPPKFKLRFLSSRFLFLGYGLSDWNLRVMLRNIQKTSSPGSGSGGNANSWAIQRNPSQLEEALWKGRNIDIFDIDLNKFIEKMNEYRP